MAARIVQYLVFACFLCITCNSVDSDRRFIKQLDIFKREVRDELSFITVDINTLFESFVNINKTLQNNANVNKGRPDENKHARVDMDNEQYVVKKALCEGLSEKYSVLEKAFESEKWLNRELQDRLKSVESELKSFESEKQLNRELQDRLKSVESELKSFESEKQLNSEQQDRLKSVESELKSFESEKQLNREQQDRLKSVESELKSLGLEKELNRELHDRINSVEDSISGMFNDVVANMTSFTNHVEGSLGESLRDIDEKLSNSISISCNANSQSGLFNVFIESIGAVKAVYCDAKTDDGGWTVLMRRQDGSVDFNRSWTDYKNGFGNADGEFWLGNEVIHALTKSKPRELRIDMHDFDGNTAYAKYDTFEIGPESDKYRLQLAGYIGTAGDDMIAIHNGKEFSTFDSDNDKWPGSNCASKYPGGWWFNRCFRTHLTGIYSHVSKIRSSRGIIWYQWTGMEKSLKFVEMKIR